MTERSIGLEIDPSRCALCGAPNECALARRERGEAAPDACWCIDRRFPASVTRRATAKDGGAACICQACLERSSGGASTPE